MPGRFSREAKRKRENILLLESEKIMNYKNSISRVKSGWNEISKQLNCFYLFSFSRKTKIKKNKRNLLLGMFENNVM